MPTPEEPYIGGPQRNDHGRKMSPRKRASKKKKRQPFQPDFHDLERRLMPSTFTVTSTSDPASLTSGTLRWAIQQANAATTPSTINFNLASSPQVITLTQGQLVLSNTADATTITGTGANLLDISGGDASRVFDVETGVTASLSGLTISEGSTTANGGGLLNYGTATLSGCMISGNSARGNGAGLTSFAALTLAGCTISGNYSYGGGGGLVAYQGTATLTGCTISGNTGVLGAGGLGNYFATATLTDCTIYGNSAPKYEGGAVQNYSMTTLTNCTVSGNSAMTAGGLSNQKRLSSSAEIVLTDTIIAGNTASGSPSDIGGSKPGAVTGSYNLVGTGGSGGLTSGNNGNLVLSSLTDLDLGPLANNGGPTETMALLSGSAAIHAGIAVSGVATDERSLALDSPPDIGAFQVQQGAPVYVVTTAADTGYGVGSLRAAIAYIDTFGNPAAIHFAIGTGQQTIDVLSALPAVTAPVTIDGTTQPGYSGTPLIELDGANAGAGAVGLALASGSDGSTISGLIINSFNEAGISIASTDNTIEGSYIGTNAAGTAGGSQPMMYGVMVSGANNTIGGTGTGAGNIIAFSSGVGVTVYNVAGTVNPTGDAILGNSIYANSGLGIDLGNDGVTLNDSEGHTGPNLFQDFPVLTTAASSNGATTVTGSITETPNTTYRIEFFNNPAADPSGYGQGQTYLTFASVTTNSSGTGTFSIPMPTNLTIGQYVSATATDPAGNTSEFSADALVAPGVSWANPNGGDWDTAANWSTDAVPTAIDDVTISIGVSSPITHSTSASDAVHTLSSTDPITISAGSLSLAAASAVSSLTLAGGTLTGSGNLNVSSSFLWTGGNLGSTGTITLGAGAQMTISGTSTRSAGGQAVNSTAAGAAVTWTSGTLEGTLNVTGNFNIATTANPFLYDATLNLTDGSGTWTGGYSLYADDDSTFTIGAGFTLNSQVDVSINHAYSISNDTTAVVVAGTLEKTQGSATTFNIPVNTTGTINVTTGGINLDDGGTITAGASFTGSGTTQFDGATMTMSGGTVTATNLALGGGTLDTAGNLSVSTFDQSGGVLEGSGNFNVSTSFLWTAGNLGSSGTITLGAGAQMAISGISTRSAGGQAVNSTAAGAAVTWNSGTLEGTLNVTGNFNIAATTNPFLYDATLNLTDGSGTWTGSYTLYADDDSTFNIGAGFTLNDQVDVTINHAYSISGDTTAVVVAGTLEKTYGSATAFNIPVNTTGTINVSTGDINLDDGGTITAGASFTGSGTTQFDGATMTMAGGNITATNIALGGGTLNTAGTISASTFDQSGGVLEGSGNFNVSTSFLWTAGNLGSSGTITLGAGAQMAISGTSTRSAGAQAINSTAAGAAVTWTSGTLEGTLNVTGNFNIATTTNPFLYDGTLNLADGSGTWTGSYTLYADDDSTFNIGAGFTLNSQVDVSINHAYSISNDTTAVVVAGTLEKTQGSATTFNIPVNTTGTINVTTGDINLDDGGTITAGASFTGSGTTQFDGATMTMSGGTVTATNLALGGGTLDTAGNLSVSTFDQSGGVLEGSGNFNVSTSFLWTAGNLGSSGTITLGAGAQMAISGTSTRSGGGQAVNSTAAGAAVTWNSGTLEGTLNVTGNFNIATTTNPFLYDGTLNLADGSGTWTGSYTLYADDDSTFNIGAGFTLNDQVDVTINHAYSISGDTTAVVVAGTLEKTYGSATTFNIPVNTTGTINVTTGDINLDDGGTITAGASFTGSGTTQFDGATMTVAGGNVTATNLALGGGTLDSAGTISASTFDQSGGVLEGSGNFDISTSFLWTAGNLGNSGTITLGAGAQMAISGTSTRSAGGQAINSTAAGAAVTWNSGTLEGTLNVTGNFNIATTTNPFLYDGTLNLADGSGTWTGSYTLYADDDSTFNIGAGFTLNDQVDVTINHAYSISGDTTAVVVAGTIEKTYGSATTFNIPVNTTGTINVTTGGINLDDGGTITAGASFTGSGTTQFDGATMTMSGGTVTATNLALGGGTLDTAGNLSVSTFDQSGGVLEGSGNFNVSTSFLWTAGNLGSSGTITLGAGAQMAISGTSTRSGGGQAVNSTAAGAAVTWNSGTLEGTLNVTGNFNIATTTNPFLYDGTLNLADGSGTWTGSYTLYADDDSTFNIGAGFTLNNQVDVTITHAYSISNDTSNVVVAGTLEKTYGSLTTFDIPVDNSGTISVASGTLVLAATPGNLSSGTLTGGTWSVEANSTLAVAGGNITTDAASIILGGSGASFPALSQLTSITNAGSLELLGGASFTTAGNLANAGSVDLESGTLIVTGAYTQASTGSLDVGIGGATAGSQFGQLEATGQVSLGGSLVVNLFNGFSPSLAQSYRILTFGSVAGDFAAETGLNLGGGLYFNPKLSGTSLDLVVTAAELYTVTSTADSGPGSLRDAIATADSTGLEWTIDFQIGTGSQTISPLSALPSITVPVLVDGTSQPGYSSTPLIELDGVSAGSGTTGLVISANNVTVKGLVISGFANEGIQVTGNDALIEGNYIGTNAAGSAALSNGGAGVSMSSSGNTIGGTAAGAGNVLSGNSNGVFIALASATGNLVEGNWIGTDASGTVAISNSANGVAIVGAATANTIGGTTSGSGNVISGNAGSGVAIAGAGTTSNVVEGDLIGTNAAGTVAIPNGYNGVAVSGGATNNTVGGTTTGARNIISGNGVVGVFFTNTGTTGNTAAGNSIGTNAAGTAALANAIYGVVISEGASGNVIGGSTTAARNVISGNTAFGIVISDSGSDANLVAGNFIGTNAAGTAAVANGQGGVIITSSASDNTVGGATASSLNVIAGNTSDGVEITGTGTSSNVVAGDCIGTNVTGTVAIANATGVQLDSGASGNTIGGLTTTPGTGLGNVIAGNTNTGIVISNPTTTDNLVEGNLIGLGASGVNPLGNGSTNAQSSSGIWLYHSPGNTIGGTTAGARNVIAANVLSGIYIYGTDAGNNLVAGNYIGTDVTGTVALGNHNDSITIDLAPNNTIGGLTGTPGTGAGNVLSAATAGSGVFIYGASATANLVEGNLIGTNATGTAALGNVQGGVAISGSADNTIGGTAAGSGNVIAANGGVGVDDVSADSNVVAGNWIGTDAGGTAALGNTGDGVEVDQSLSVTIGGTALGAGNLISGNDSSGVEIIDSTGSLIQGNLIGLDQTGTLAFGNAGAGVLVDDGSISNTIGGPVSGGRNFISGNAEGIEITGSATAGTDVAGNLIGTDVEGTSAVGNTTAGVGVSGGTGTTIGGTSSLARNVISGNDGDGVDIGGGATNTVILGDYIGSDQTGTKPLANSGSGLSLNDALGVTIGGTAQGAANVISANTHAGVSISGSSNTGILLLGNRIGTDDTGTASLGNGTFGVLVSGTPAVTIGGTATGDGNIISSNTTAGIGLYANTTGALVEKNLIGTDITGSVALGNGNGIQIDGGSSNSTIGGTAAGAVNTIAFSTGIGVDVDATAGTGNDIRLNAIFSNTGLGIDLGGDGVTLNNSVPHTGPNDHENFPVITGVTSAGGTTNITGMLNSTASTTFAIDFYTLSSLNASGYGEGRHILGSMALTTGSNGATSFSFSFPTPSGGTQFVTATATDPAGNTSEFSKEYGTDIAPVAVIGFTSITVNAGAPVTFSGLGSTDASGNPLTYTWSFGDGATATGPDPTHTFTTPKTDTVTLTVSDGFGGVSTSSGTVKVNDVAPVFTADSYSPPLTFAAPAPRVGFGVSVASNYGNVAIGAPSANGTGAVYLYDGVTTANETISTYAYGQLLQVVKDPNPEPGDEFGASLAVVGNDLVVGAPGSSLSGPGDGVVYVFDANDESTTFGDLLATLTLPNSAALADAHFGAAVGATNTNIVVGAPGEDAATGAAYEFEGDTTQADFGDLLLPIANPTSLADSDFGAAVAGDGNNVIVGAPTAEVGGEIGAVFLFDGTTGMRLTSIANPDPSTTTGFGSAVATVGSNILIGSPNDNNGAGAAFLYAPPVNVGTSTLLEKFTQPGGGNFGTSVAGTQNTALIGAPGASLGTSDAGAAYLFDANSASPTFGLLIAAAEEPLPMSGNAFGTAVGFDDGALVAGSPQAGVVDLYQPTATLSLSSAATFATSSFNSVILSSTFTDANPSIGLEATINWGDGSSPTKVNLPAGSYAFSAPHDYTSNPSSGAFTIGVTLSDAAGETALAQTAITISDPAPRFAAPGLVLSSSSIDENGSVTVNGQIESPGGIHTNTVSIDWGDGSLPTTIPLGPGVDQFQTSHTYLNNPPEVSSGNYSIVATVTNDEGKTSSTSASVTVSNVAPEFTSGSPQLSSSTIDEGGTVTLSGEFTDPGTLDPHIVTIDWGDGSTPAVLSSQLDQIATTSTPGLFSFSAQHQYLYNSAEAAQGVTFNTYAIDVSVADDVTSTSAATSIVVDEEAPTIQLVSNRPEDQTDSSPIYLTALVTDPDSLATDQVAWSVANLSGTTLASGTGTNISFPNNDGVVAGIVTATVTSSDGETGTDSAQVVVINQSNASVTITSSSIMVTVGSGPGTTTPLGSADRLIALVYGAGDLVDATRETIPVELDGLGTNEVSVGGDIQTSGRAITADAQGSHGSDTLLGGSGNDLLVAGPGANSLVGGAGDDTLVSNAGDDTLVGGTGNDVYQINPGLDPVVIGSTNGTNTLDFSIAAQGITINLGTEDQTQTVDSAGDQVVLIGAFDIYIASAHGDDVTANAGDDLIYGGIGNTTIHGGSGNDSVVGGSGNDVIYGGTGNLTINSGSGDDSIIGGSGNDIIYGGTGTTTITTGSGVDSVIGGTGNDIIYGGIGTSTIAGGSGAESIIGGSGNDIIYAGTGNTTITSGAGNDSIVGGTGNDVIYGGTGTSTITAGTGNDSIVGGTGNDIIYTLSANATITSGAGNDSIVGGSGNDIIYAGTGSSTITGGTGNDSIVGGTGNDIIYGGTGNTTINGNAGNDSILGGTGNDVIYAGTGTSTITGGTGNDSIIGGTGNDIIYGGTGDTTINGGSGNDSIIGGSGNDLIYGGTGTTTINSGTGNDSVIGGTGNDIIYGGVGNTTITAGGGDDTIIGGTGNDVIYGGVNSSTLTSGGGNDSIVGGTGNDIIYGGAGNVTITGGTGNDSITGGAGSDSILGGTGNDIIYGGIQSSTIIGGSGDDTIVGGNGNDIIYGGSGNDSIEGGYGAESIVGGSGNDVLIAGNLSSTITGGTGNDLIIGGFGNDIIFGGSGDCTIVAGDGNDSIVGGSGDDFIYGGKGNSTMSAGTGDSTISGGGGSDILTGSGLDSWLMFYGSTNMTLTNTTFSTSGGSVPASVSSISGFQHAVLAPGPGDFTVDASAFTLGGVMLLGGTGDDTLIGTDGPDTLEGGAGNDSLIGGGGNDTFAFNSGSSGSQTVVEQPGTGVAGLDFSQAPAGISINLSQTGPQAVMPATLNDGALTLTLADPLGIDNVLGSSYNNTIIGNGNDNTLIGGGGGDLIAGLAGNDVMEGALTRTVYLDFDTYELPGQHVYTQAERNAIQAQITADYSAFSYDFTQIQPQSGPYTTIAFNDPALVGLEGGISSEIDWRDLNISGTTTLTAYGLSVVPPDSGGVNVNNFLGGPGQPAATSADVIGLSATIAAHELGHLSGLQHADSFGPIGSGIYSGVNPDLYNPSFPGPTDADETILHIMASGASVNATLQDAINDPFFGEREAIGLSYGENGSPTNEATTAHYSMSDAQSLALEPLTVPDTDLEGVDADNVFNVTAADVVGYLGETNGVSNTDYYSFTAQAGTLITFQLMSALLTRNVSPPGTPPNDYNQGPFDTYLTIFNSSGQVIEYNDDSFQDSDSTIIDLTLPYTGTYYAMVTSSSKSAALGEPLTGDYELFMYTFALGTDPATGDSLYAGSGDDTVIAGSADDTIAAQPQDTIVYGSGTGAVLQNAPYLNVSAGANQSVNEGTSVTLTGAFLDPDDADTHTYDWHVIASSGQQIADGTGPTFTFIPGNAGTYAISFTVKDQSGGSASAGVVITSLDIRPVLTAPTVTQNVAAGQSESINLGGLVTAGVGPFMDTINWGDDSQTSTYDPTGSGALSYNHTYATPGTYTISEDVSEFAGGSVSTSFMVDVTQTATPATNLAISPNTGISSGVTDTGAVTLTGNLSVSGMTVDVFDATTNTDLGDATVASGSFSLALNLAQGNHALRVQTSLGGSIADASYTVLVDLTPPTSHVVNSLGTSQTTDSFPVSVSFSDPAGSGGAPASGVATVELWVSVNNGAFSLSETMTIRPTDSGTVTFMFAGKDRNIYAFHSVTIDAAGNVESKNSNTIEASTSVPDLNPPVTHVLASNPTYSWGPFPSSDFSGLAPSYYSNGVFTLYWAGADPDQNSGTPAGSIAVVDIYVEIDGSTTPTLVGQLSGGSPNSNGVYSGSITYDALADGQSHNYSFFSVGIDDEQKAQAMPTAPDVTFDGVKYSSPLSVENLVVEKGIAERSFIEYLDVDFNQTTSSSTYLASLASELSSTTATNKTSYLELLWYGEGTPSASSPKGSVNLFGSGTTAKVTLTGNDLSISFGANGITGLLTESGVSGTGKPTTNFGDGWYALGIDTTGGGGPVFWQPFFRLFGSATGDTTVTGPYTAAGTDAYVVYNAEGQSGTLLNADVDGSGAVNSKDLTYTADAKGDTVGAGFEQGTSYPAFQLFAGSAVAAPVNATLITQSDVQALVPAAISAWQAAGLDAADVGELESVPIQVSNLGTTILGLEAGGVITINQTAAGYNWFVSAGSGSNQAFGPAGPDGESLARPGSPAADEVDLVTVLEHELGHVLGLPDNAEDGDLMDITIGLGVRRVPSSADLAAVASSSTTAGVVSASTPHSAATVERSQHFPSNGPVTAATVDAALASMLSPAGGSEAGRYPTTIDGPAVGSVGRPSRLVIPNQRHRREPHTPAPYPQGAYSSRFASRVFAAAIKKDGPK